MPPAGTVPDAGEKVTPSGAVALQCTAAPLTDRVSTPDPPVAAGYFVGFTVAVTLACFATGDASVYYRTGGGMVGGIGHENVRNIAKEFVDQARTVLPRMIQPNGYPLPGNDRIRFYALTAKGPYTVEADRETLADPESDLAPLYYTGQEVVSQMRQVQEQKSKAAAGPPIPVGG